MRVLNPLVFGAAIALSGCSLSLQFDCSEDGDCANLEGNFMCNGTVCVELEPDAAPDMTPEPEGFSCADDKELFADNCFDLLGPLPMAPGASPEARLAVFLDQHENFELIAVQVPNGPFAGVGNEETVKVLHHTVDHINNSGGFTFGTGLVDSRQLAVLICYDALGDGGISGGVTAANHAVSCGAKALVSTYLSDRTLEIFREVAVPNEVPMVAPGAISPEIPIVRGALGNTGLLWRIKVPGSTLLESVMGLIDELAYQKVHLVYRSESLYDAAMHRQLEPRLGARLASSLDLTGGVAGSSPGAVQTYLAGFADDPPDLVVSLTGELGDLLDQAVGGINAANANDLAFDFITVEGARSTDAANIVASQTDHQRLSCRTMGISSGIRNGDTTGGWRFSIDRDREDYDLSAEDLDTLPAPTLGYVDGVVVTAYALASALRRNGGDATTEFIVDGLKLLSDPANDVVVPLQWSSGLAALGENGRGQMNYEGVSGSINLVTETQDVSGRKTELWQYDFDGFTGSVVELGDLVSDDANDFTPNAAAIQALRESHMNRAECADYPYLGTLLP